jgi:hypothetical protein
MLDRRRDVNIAQGIVVAVLGVLSIAWDWRMYRNVADALRAGLRGGARCHFHDRALRHGRRDVDEAAGPARPPMRRDPTAPPPAPSTAGSTVRLPLPSMARAPGWQLWS